MRVRVRTSVDPDSWLVVSAGHRGSYPLAGIVAEIADARRHGGAWDLHLRFAGLTERRRDELVRQIFSRQANAAA